MPEFFALEPLSLGNVRRRVEHRRTMAIAITPETNINALVRDFPLAEAVLKEFGLACGGCGVNKTESIAEGARAHGLRTEPILAALTQARLSGRVPTIMNVDKQREAERRAPQPLQHKAVFKNVIAVMSGKGGVGKSLTTGLLAVGLRRLHYSVGILDADITGPSIPRLFNLREPLGISALPPAVPGEPKRQPLMIPAVSRAAIEIVSSNLLTPEEDTAMIWRGPILSGVIGQFYNQVRWSDLDYLLIDLPPGTSDAPLTVLQQLSIDGVVLVTMPQALATMIVRKAANLVKQFKKPILGVVENMSYFVAPDTGVRYDIFGPSYADRVAELAQAPVFARMPLRPSLTELADAGRIEETEDPICDELARALVEAVAARPRPKEVISLI